MSRRKMGMEDDGQEGMEGWMRLESKFSRKSISVGKLLEYTYVLTVPTIQIGM